MRGGIGLGLNPGGQERPLRVDGGDRLLTTGEPGGAGSSSVSQYLQQIWFSLEKLRLGLIAMDMCAEIDDEIVLSEEDR